MTPLQEGVVKAVLVAASVGAGTAVITSTVTNAAQDERLERVEEDVKSFHQMREAINRIDKTVAVIEERLRHDDQ